MEWNIFFNFLKIIYNTVLVSLFIILIGFIIGKIMGKIVEHLLNGIEINKLLKKLGSNVSFDKALSQLTKYIIYVITILVLLQFLGIRNLVLIILTIIFSVLIFLSLFMAVIMFIPNLVFGFFIKKKIKKGDFLAVGNINGKVKKCRFSDVLIESKKDLIAVPYTCIREKIRTFQFKKIS